MAAQGPIAGCERRKVSNAKLRRAFAWSQRGRKNDEDGGAPLDLRRVKILKCQNLRAERQCGFCGRKLICHSDFAADRGANLARVQTVRVAKCKELDRTGSNRE